MRAVLVDPYAKRVTEVDYSGEWRDIYSLIRCQCFDVVCLTGGDGCVFVDDEGLLSANADTQFFSICGSPPLAGMGLILGDADDEGETMEAPKPPTTTGPLFSFLVQQTREGGLQNERASSDSSIRPRNAALARKHDIFAQRISMY